MNLIALPAFSDNYIWMLHDGRRCIVVDPGDAAVVVAALEQHRLTLAGILVTHHHADHVGGLHGLRPLLDGPVYAPATETIPGPTIPVRDGDVVDLLGCAFEVIDVPGHTAGHVAYLHTPPDSAPISTPKGAPDSAPVLFCGDTLFSGGCGRLFEGTPAQMWRSLSRLGGLSGATRVCCAHEYTLSNLRFAHVVEGDNDALAHYTAWCETQRSQHLPTLPSTVATERAVNPFLRCAEPGVVQSALDHGAASRDAVDVFATLRSWKNNFK